MCQHRRVCVCACACPQMWDEKLDVLVFNFLMVCNSFLRDFGAFGACGSPNLRKSLLWVAIVFTRRACTAKKLEL